MNIHTIYKITHTPTGMSYIGYSGMVERRWKVYRKLKLGGSYKRKIERAIAKYGIDQFEFTILYQSLHRDHTLDEMEDHFITEFDTLNTGFNMRVGGQWAHTDYQTTEAVKAKISKVVRERMADPSVREKLRAAKLGKTQDPEKVANRIARMVESEKYQEHVAGLGSVMTERWKNPTKNMIDGKKIAAQKLIGKPLSDDHRASISAGNKSSVVWLLRWEGVYHFVTDNVNNYIDANFPFRYPVVYTTLKKHPDYEDKSKLVWGTKGRGPSAGFEVIRIPESMLSMGTGMVDHLIACKAITETSGLNEIFS